ncbi:MAG: HAD family hydrolase [Myxococcota bacterium]
MTEPLRTAFVYDFDGTLAPGSVQEHELLPHLGIDGPAFWGRVKEETKRRNADEILVYMHLLVEEARSRGEPLTRDRLAGCGPTVRLFEGVRSWFERIDAHARERNLVLEHYVISSGTHEILEHTPIARHFQAIFASRYAWDAAGVAMWPAVAINYTTKTQYLFRINKGVLNHWDNEQVNRWVPMAERPVPFSRMVYFGDGDTDIPAMKMTHYQGGHAIAVFDPEKWREPRMQRKVHQLISEDRANYVVPADYTEGSQLDVTVKGILGKIARNEAGYRVAD